MSLFSREDGCAALASILSDPRQRRMLAILLEQSAPMTERDLAVQLVAREEETPAPEVEDGDRREALVELHHRSLPRLEDAGWIERHPERIVTLDRARAEDSDLPSLLAEGDGRWEALATLLARPRRREVASIVADRDRPIAVEDLAARIRSREGGSGQPEEGGEGLDLVAALHHTDLPQLETAGLIEYDREEGTVAAGDDLNSLRRWLESAGPTQDGE